MSYLELYKTISKPWASIEEISIIANCGRDSAIKIRNKIEQDILKQGKKLPKGRKIVVPTKMVVEYLGLDLDYIVNMAKSEAKFKLENGALSYANISR